MLMKVKERPWRIVVLFLALHPYNHSPTHCLLKGTKSADCLLPEAEHVACLKLIRLFSLRHKTHIWINCVGCTVTAVTSHPVDRADGRQDSWQHGTKLVWAAVPSVVCFHDQGWLWLLAWLLLHPGSAWEDWLGAGQREGWLCGYPGNERMDWSGSSLCLSSASSVYCGRETGPIDWTLYISPWRTAWLKECTNQIGDRHLWYEQLL